MSRTLFHALSVGIALLTLVGCTVSAQAQTSEILVWMDAQHTRPILPNTRLNLPYSEPGATTKSSLHVYVLVSNSALDDPNEPVLFFVDQGLGLWELASNPHKYAGPGLENWFSAPLPPASPTPQSATLRIAYPARNVSFSFTVDFIGGTFPPPGQNRAPSVTLSYTPALVTPNDILRLLATASDPDGDPLSYTWYVNGQRQTEASSNSVRFDNPPPNTYTIRVVVSDDNGGSAEDSVTITVSGGGASPAPPPPGPCAIEYMTLNPGSQLAGPLLTPGHYLVWTSTADPNRTFNDWLSWGPFDFEPGHRYTIVMDDQTAIDGAVSVFKQDNGMAAVSAFYVNEAFDHELAVTVCPLAAPPPPPPPPSPCDIAYMTLNPGSQLAGPLLSPGRYLVWTSVAGPNRTFNDWLNTGPFEFKADHEYLLIIKSDTDQTGAVDVREGFGDGPQARVQYVNAHPSREFAVTVCPQAPAAAPPPAGGVATVLDANGNGVIDDAEIREAVRHWITGQPLPGAGDPLDDDAIHDLIQMWILGTPIGAQRARPAPASTPPSFTLGAPSPLVREVRAQAPDTATIGVQLFDLAGRLVLEARGQGDVVRFELIASDGRPLANGVYLAWVRLQRPDGNRRAALRKLALVR